MERETGFEPATFCLGSPELVNAIDGAALEHENWIAYVTGVVRCAVAALVRRDGGVVTILSDLPFDWFNQVLVERPEATSADLLAAAGCDVAALQANESGRPIYERLGFRVDVRYVSYRPGGCKAEQGLRALKDEVVVSRPAATVRPRRRRWCDSVMRTFPRTPSTSRSS